MDIVPESPHPNPLVNEFLASLNEMELKAYHIAKSHLNTTFNIEKSNAFLRWKSERQTHQSSQPTN